MRESEDCCLPPPYRAPPDAGFLFRATSFAPVPDRSHTGPCGRVPHKEKFDPSRGRARLPFPPAALSACGDDFSLRGLATGILADDHIDPVDAQQGDLVLHGEGAAGEQVFDIGRIERRIDRIDAAHEIVVLRSRVEGLRLLPADGQEDTARRRAKCCHRIGNRRDARPAVAGNLYPAEPFQLQKRDAGDGACRAGIGGNLFGEGMRGVDQKINRMRCKIGRKALGAAEAAGAHRHGLRRGIERAAGERQRDGEIGTFAKVAGQVARFRRAAQNEDASLVHA